MGKICNISKGKLVSIMTMNKTHHHLQARSIEVSFNRLPLLKPGFHIFIQHFPNGGQQSQSCQLPEIWLLLCFENLIQQ